jgi:prevent-host-death family protein
MMERMVSATDARVHFGELMRWVVESQKPVIVERAGKPHVVVLAVDEYERLLTGRQAQDDWRELARQARDQVEADLGERELPAPEEIIRQMREERDAQLLALR